MSLLQHMLDSKAQDVQALERTTRKNASLGQHSSCPRAAAETVHCPLMKPTQDGQTDGYGVQVVC
jgi:hypothetical protein